MRKDTRADLLRKYIKNKQSFPDYSLRSISRDSGVSVATLSRFTSGKDILLSRAEKLWDWFEEINKKDEK